MRKWEHINDIELDVYIQFYNEHLSSLVRKGLRNPNKENYEIIELMQNKIAELENESKLRLME